MASLHVATLIIQRELPKYEKFLNLVSSDSEACRMLESVQDLLYQQEKLETVNLESKRGGGGDLIRKTKSLKKLSKKDISAPCNFKHVSGKCM